MDLGKALENIEKAAASFTGTVNRPNTIFLGFGSKLFQMEAIEYVDLDYQWDDPAALAELGAGVFIKVRGIQDPRIFTGDVAEEIRDFFAKHSLVAAVFDETPLPEKYHVKK